LKNFNEKDTAFRAQSRVARLRDQLASDFRQFLNNQNQLVNLRVLADQFEHETEDFNEHIVEYQNKQKRKKCKRISLMIVMPLVIVGYYIASRFCGGLTLPECMPKSHTPPPPNPPEPSDHTNHTSSNDPVHGTPDKDWNVTTTRFLQGWNLKRFVEEHSTAPKHSLISSHFMPL